MIRQGIDSLEDKYRDHVIEYAQRNGVSLDDAEAISLIGKSFSTASGISESLMRVLDAEAQVAAFGQPGEPGDPDQIIHLGTRFVRGYEELLDWASNLRGTSISDNQLRETARIAARFVDKPVRDVREFVAELTRQCDTLVERLAADEQIELDLTLTLEIEEGLQEVFSEALGRCLPGDAA